MPLPSLPRRTLVTSVAWTTPAVVAASAAPVFAGSGVTTLSVASGNTRTALIWQGNWGLEFDGFTIQSDRALGASDLKVTLSATSPAEAAYVYHYAPEATDDPAPWVTGDQPVQRLTSLTFAYPGPVPAGVAVPLTGGLALALRFNWSGFTAATAFTITVTVTAPGATPVVLTFSNPGD